MQSKKSPLRSLAKKPSLRIFWYQKNRSLNAGYQPLLWSGKLPQKACYCMADPQKRAQSAEDTLTPESYAKEWFVFAEMDLASAEFLLAMYPLPIAIICYHCQQSAEKCLKGLLALKNQTPPKTHDLPFLIDTCKHFFPEIMTVSTQCAALNPFSSQPRYPRELLITERDMQAAIQNAKAVYTFTQPIIATNSPAEFGVPNS